ncbi:DUF2909 domain-containing protein [Saccharospirillum salsuginis]|uniref:DUF2909 domain-containing protein n=1 Tax=Saccharospirillum salsuginis TaxID=418750 RepID=A0A918K419_9GAMM|nr:DUF2909 family protein [Saccharospirillum salsuginis]GGX48300.1 hypothetical protein GCM10007392_14030 [Saccharospirillum salsuginis]
MLLKAILIILIIAMLLSLSGGLVALFKDEPESKRLVKLLTIRVSLAVLIIVVLIVGFVTGELTQNAPWSGRY